MTHEQLRIQREETQRKLEQLEQRRAESSNQLEQRLLSKDIVELRCKLNSYASVVDQMAEQLPYKTGWPSPR